MPVLGQDGAEALLAFNKRAVRQILAVPVQQVEGEEARLAAPKQEVAEKGLPVTIQTDEISIEDDAELQLCAEGFREC